MIFKSVFSSLLIPIILIKNVLKKTQLDNFVGGVLIGALFSLIVNVVTVEIQESIQKQRALESIENEIVMHVIQANNVIKGDQEKIAASDSPNYYKISYPYDDHVWRSSDSTKYLSQIDPEQQSLVITYYSIVIQQTNEMNQKDNELAKEKLSDCYFDFDKKLSLDEKEFCKELYQQLLVNEVKSAEQVKDYSLQTLNKFHPTKDRLNDFFLRTLMGDKSIRVLSGK